MKHVEIVHPPVGPSERHRTSGVVVLMLGLAACLLAACENKVQQAAPPPPEVLVSEVVQRDVPIYNEWVGTTDGNINAQIRARVQGYLQSRNYTEGSVVRAGDLMFTIDPRPYQAALEQANGELGRADAAVTKTQQDVARYTPLAAEGAISQQELDNAVQANRAAKAAADSARAAVDKAKLDLDWTQVKSPIDGIAGISVAQVGDLIGESAVLTTVSQVDPIKVSFPISEQEYLQLATRVELDPSKPRPRDSALELILADGSVFPHPGTVSVANRQVDIKTGTMIIVGLFPNPGGLLRPGQFAKVRASVETRKGALLVPQRAVLEQQGQYLVAVVGADNKVDIHPVKVGNRVGADWIVMEGLKPGDHVIAEGLQKVRAGSTVNPKPFTASTATAAQPGA